MSRRGSITSAECDVAPAEVAAHYDALDEFYRAIWGSHIHHGLWIRGDESYNEARENLVRIVAEKARISPGSSVCDIGCGYGETAMWIAEHQQARVTGITISHAQYEFAVARARILTGPTFVLGDWLSNELPEASFDAAISIESAEHMTDLQRFFRQARRVLRTGGRLVVAAWLSAEDATATHRRWLLDPIARAGRMAGFRRPSEYQSDAAAHRFAAEECDDYSDAAQRTWRSVALTFGRTLVTRPHMLRYLVGKRARNRGFILATLRIWTAYQMGVIRYHLFTFRAI